ncbi:lycopene beta-cyclase [Noviherbaspirillum humi]|uniref:Lycopene beta-cyclase n=1 Tax=Noviherbaspirillum humi TaxID=1688639 RepID=A0A239L3E4_9BURK|nr:lycopene beta-cyclase CrtY [Noviherbaspirillum humi]SNT24840.1 lycopene beta-cyclase [Noviherbaspirillum humi]
MHDLILVGGGLANGLIAWRLNQQRPDLRILLLEREGALGGNHTWSFYGPDLTPAQHAWLAPLISHRWPGYEVRFPTHHRRLSTPCFSIASARFHEVLTQALKTSVRLNAAPERVGSNSVRLHGETLQARVVIDGRGPAPSAHLRCAWQKFLGQEVTMAQPHGQALPIIMDATVAQDDGYRFVYTLPLDERRLLIEDTYYGAEPGFDADALRGRIAAYAAGRGWRIDRIGREETGVLPVTLDGDIERFWTDKPAGLACSGLRAALFHATTGYSLPFAVRLTDRLADSALQPEDFHACISDFSRRQWQRQAYLRLLNRMLFFASAPAQRYRILQRFYRLPQPLIERFYAGRLTPWDQLRILSGKPPVPLGAALRAMFAFGKEPSSKPS